MSCNAYVAKTFAHVAGLIGITAAGTQISQFDAFLERPKNMFEKIALIILPLIVFVSILFMSPGPLKYLGAVLLTLHFGISTRTYVKSLEHKNALKRVLVTTAAISAGILFLALMDKSGQFLKFFPILMVSLLGYLSVSLYYFFSEEQKPGWLDSVGVALFSLFMAYDIQEIRAAAKRCRGKADYIDQSFGLYLDIMNIFTRLGAD
jgi:FtsH-binding integral membrane protein